ncbi:MAG: HAMP domain-containing sensor histidine kinase [Negativicutes bacterium]|nr:HAMP domain-containing sensor histidine kinase [Negativicutes bacterium]
MTVSVRTKLFLALSGVVFFFVLLSFGATHLGLEKYYIWQKKNILLTSSQSIDALYHGSPEEISTELERLANVLGAGILITTREHDIKYSSFGPFMNQKLPDHFAPGPARQAPAFPPPPLTVKTREAVDNQTILEMQHDDNIKIDFMTLERKLKNGDSLIIRQPLAQVSESAAVAAQFMVFTGILSILAGSFWAFFFAKKFTTPILELSRLAQNMSRLDFSQRRTITANDEIGQLGASINHLSDHLDAAISELNQKNRQLLADVENERKLDKMRKDFVSSVSHELKTPLSLILGYAEGLKENVAQDDESKNYYCSIIMDEAEKMDKLVKDLLNLAQIESGFYQLTRIDFDLSAMLADIALKYQTVLAEKDITLTLDIKESNFVNGDVLRIDQILFNLLNNAIAHAEFAKNIKITVTDIDERIRVYVYNSGRPIPQDSLEKIWTSFYKADEARTRDGGGYGLGLSIVRAIQELHGNSFGVENLQDGVSFWFDLDKADKR